MLKNWARNLTLFWAVLAFLLNGFAIFVFVLGHIVPKKMAALHHVNSFLHHANIAVAIPTLILAILVSDYLGRPEIKGLFRR
jgi:uncharacterized BrkB/YihY/UPF0761 family membrane protein